MATISITQEFPVSPDVLWDELRHIERHVRWMHDAVDITFHDEQREGVGTRFLCTTKVGPFVTKDVMIITEWTESKAMGVEHRGLVRGSGTFRLETSATGTALTWRETLRFPWWAAGYLGSLVASPVLRALWRSNLRALSREIATDGSH